MLNSLPGSSVSTMVDGDPARIEAALKCGDRWTITVDGFVAPSPKIPKLIVYRPLSQAANFLSSSYLIASPAFPDRLRNTTDF